MEYSHLPDLNGLATLRAVIEKGGVTEAARVLNVGQPAVSKRLHALEECYGVTLLERIAGRLKPTAAGEHVYRLAVQMLERQLALREDLQNLARGRNTLHLETATAIGEHLLPDLLLRFAELHPEFSVVSRMRYSRHIVTRLATGDADLALLESAPDHPDILVQRWMDDEIWLVCGARHPLASTESIPVERLRELRYVMRERRSATRDTTDQALRRIGIEEVPVAIEAGSTETIVEILMRGQHVAFLPRFAVGERVAQGVVHRVHVPGFTIPRTLWIARHRDNLRHPVAEVFIAMLREYPAPPRSGETGLAGPPG